MFCTTVINLELQGWGTILEGFSEMTQVEHLAKWVRRVNPGRQLREVWLLLVVF